MANRPAPTVKQIRLFGFVWLLFFAALGGIALWRPRGLVVAGAILGAAWLLSMAFNPAPRREQIVGCMLPALLAGLGFWGMRSADGLPLLIVACAVGLLGALSIMIAPIWGRKVYDGWSKAGEPLGWSITRLVLGGVYYLVLTPIGLLMRVAGRDPLDRRLDEARQSYWVESRATRREPESYFRQF